MYVQVPVSVGVAFRFKADTEDGVVRRQAGADGFQYNCDLENTHTWSSSCFAASLPLCAHVVGLLLSN